MLHGYTKICKQITQCALNVKKNYKYVILLFYNARQTNTVNADATSFW